MEIREATVSDADDVARVARASLAESYGHFIDEGTIDEVVEAWYATDELDELLAGEAAVFLVAEVDDEAVAFVQAQELETDPLAGEIHWLHVEPEHRGRDLGVQLLGRAQEEFEKREVAVLRGLVLAENEDGTAFYEDHGFDRVDAREVEIGGETVEEFVYEKAISEKPDEQVVEAITGPEDRELFVSFSEAERGLKAPFYAVYGTRELSERYGWFCGNCETLDNAMDSMGRIVCNECGNKRKATRWDATYL